jgi:hypothetical protein
MLLGVDIDDAFGAARQTAANAKRRIWPAARRSHSGEITESLVSPWESAERLPRANHLNSTVILALESARVTADASATTTNGGWHHCCCEIPFPPPTAQEVAIWEAWRSSADHSR